MLQSTHEVNSFSSHDTGVFLSTLALRDPVPFLCQRELPVHWPRNIEQRHVRSPPSVPESCKEKEGLESGNSVHGRILTGCLGIGRPVCRRPTRLRIGGARYLRFSTHSLPFWQCYLDLLPFGLWVVSHPPSPMQSCPLFIHPFPPPSLSSFFPSLLRRLLFSRFFRQPLPFLLLVVSCSLIHKK